jgi:hypothetical protein
MLVSCAGRQTAWTTIEPPDIPDGAEAFVLVADQALHLTDVVERDGVLHARVQAAWELPPAGVVAIADDKTKAPHQIARQAGWPTIRIKGRHLAVPITAIRSARAAIDSDDDESEANSSDPRVVVELLGAAADAILTAIACPCWCRSRRF